MKTNRFVLLALLAACSLTFFGCHKDKTPAVTVKLVTDGLGINDKSYNASAWEGMLRFYGDSVGDEERFGTLYDVAICNESGRYYSDLKALSEEQTDLLILTGFALTDALKSVSSVFPNQKYLIIDGMEIPSPNVMNYLFAAEEGSYLVGVLAALQSQAEGVPNPTFGFIGGVKSDAIVDFEIGFVQGVRSVLPNAEIYDFYTDDWSRPELAAEKAKIWYDGGVYAIFTAAGMCGNGTIAEAISHRKAGKNVWAIGVDKDQYGEGEYGVGKSAVLTSMIKRVDNAVELGLKSVQEGSFKGGEVILSLKDGAVGFSVTNTELAASAIKEVQNVQSEIIAGKTPVIATYKDRAAANALVQTVRHF